MPSKAHLAASLLINEPFQTAASDAPRYLAGGGRRVSEGRWQRSVLEVVRQVTQALAAPARIGLVLTDRPAVALCLANRRASIRAAWGVSVASVREATQLIGANLLVLNPAQHGVYELRGMIREFLRGRHDCPADYRQALGGEA